MNYKDAVVEVLSGRIVAGAMSAAAVMVEQDGKCLFDWAGGTRSFGGAGGPARVDSVFLIASITKPLVTSTVAKLVEQGRIDLEDPVAKYVPEFAANGKERVTLRQCFTHTSGLTDMVPDDPTIRPARRPLSEFVASACNSRLLFPPGTDARYQSSGILMLAEIAERVTGRRIRDLLSEWLFLPAGATSAHLGWREEFGSRNVEAKNVHGPESASWNHNSAYWRDFGAPWGGVHCTVADVSKVLHVMLNGGLAADGKRVFEPGTVRLMLSDHTAAMPTLPESVRLRDGWGLGWRINRMCDSGWFGSAVPAGAFGHYGATGTIAWADPASRVSFVLFTNGTSKDEWSTLKVCGNVTATALCG